MLVLFVLLLVAIVNADPAVLLVALDGVRPIEIFGGIQSEYIDSFVPTDQQAKFRADFDGPSADERRSKLVPFLTDSITAGQAFGNRDSNSIGTCTNGYGISAPGYAELLTGFADPRINSNADIDNPNPTVFEFLHPRVGSAAAVSWPTLTHVLNVNRSGIPTFVSNEAGLNSCGPAYSRRCIVDLQMADVPAFVGNEQYDGFIADGGLSMIAEMTPRAMFINFGLMDPSAHAGRYDLYARRIHLADQLIGYLWTELQKHPAYIDQLTLLVATDHGRGNRLTTWTGHGADPDSLEWLAIGRGPTILPVGNRVNTSVTQAQMAATVASVVGFDFTVVDSRIQPPLPFLIRIDRNDYLADDGRRIWLVCTVVVFLLSVFVGAVYAVVRYRRRSSATHQQIDVDLAGLSIPAVS